MKDKIMIGLGVVIVILLSATHWFAYMKGTDNMKIEYRDRIIIQKEYVNETIKKIDADIISTSTDDLRKWMLSNYSTK